MLLEKVEDQARRVVANELKALVDDSGYGAFDEVGRHRLRELCKNFHEESADRPREEELKELEWRVQALADNRGIDAGDTNQQAQAQLRVPHARQPVSWWNPRYWTMACPTIWEYGDCVWGL